MSLDRVLKSQVHPSGIKSVLMASYAAADHAGDLTQKTLKPIVQRAAEEGRAWARSFLGNTKKAFVIGGYDVSNDLDRMLEDLNANKVEKSYVKQQLALGRSPRAKFNHNRTIARTASMNVYVKSALIEMQEDGLTHVRRMEVHDNKTSPICRTLNATIHEIGKLLSYMYPLTHDSHPNCVLPETLISAGCQANIIDGFVATYKGPVIQITIADGRRLSVTANHMLLTPNGFVRARHLREGDDVIGCSNGEWGAFRVPYDDHKPATAQNVIQSLSKSFGVRSECMELSAKDFHGDAVFMNGNVDVIPANRKLWSNGQSSIGQHVNHRQLAVALNDTGSLLTDGPFTQLLVSSLYATDGGMSRLREVKSLLLAKLFHSHGIGFGEAASIHSMLTQDPVYRDLINTDGITDLQSRLTRLVSGYDGLVIDDSTPLEAELLQSAVDSVLRDSHSLSHVCDRFAGFVSPLKITHVNRYTYHGPVYDLHTATSNYWAEGIVSSNCRGTFVPHFGYGSYRPMNRDFDVNVSSGKFENAPREFLPWLKKLQSSLPFKKVVFRELPGDYQSKVHDGVLSVDLMDDEDPREILLEESARHFWKDKSIRDNFEEVKKLRDMRLIEPAKTYHNDWEFFMHLFQDYKLNQIEDPLLYAWFKQNVG